MIIENIKEAAALSDITAVITNSDSNIETQLNRYTGIEDLPIMMVSWDLQTSITINEMSMLDNPTTKVVLMLMTKSDSKEKVDYESAAIEMANLFQVFVQNLNNILTQYNLSGGPSVTDINYTLTPKHGSGKHSGVVGSFTMINQVINCK